VRHDTHGGGGDRPRLYDEQRPHVVDGPFDVLRTAETILEERGERDQLIDPRLLVDQRVDVGIRLAECSQRSHHVRATADAHAARIHRPRDECVAQPGAILEQHVVVAAVGEQHARASRRHLTLDDHSHAAQRQGARAPIEQRAVRPVRRPAREHGALERCFVAHVQDRVELAGERTLAGILSHRRASNDDGSVGEKRSGRGHERGAEPGVERRAGNERANGSRCARQCGGIACVEPFEHVVDPAREIVLGQVRLEGRDAQHDAVRYRDAERDQPRQRRSLASDGGDVAGDGKRPYRVAAPGDRSIGERQCRAHAGRAFTPM
jgi:hypothetical protein